MRWAALFLVACTAPAAPLPQHAPKPTRPTARAHVVAAGERLGGVEADGAAGDLRLDNGLVSFVVDRADHALGFADSGGSLIDAAPDGGEDAVKQLFGYLADTFPRQPINDKTEIAVAAGDEAVVVAHGHDSGDATIGIETRYTLKAGSRAIEITTVVENRGGKPVTGYAVGDAIQWGRAERFAPGIGEALGGHRTIGAGFMLGLGAKVAYAYVSPDGKLPGRHGSAWSDLNVGKVDVPPGEKRSVKRWFVAGPPDGAAVVDEIAALRGEHWQRVTGQVHDERGRGLGGARVVFAAADGKPALLVRSRSDGSFAARLPPGHYRARAEGLARAGETVDVGLGEADQPVSLGMSAPARLHVTVEDGGPVRLTLFGQDGAADPHLGMPFESPGGNVAYVTSGTLDLEAPPGHYRLVASRGPMFTIDERAVALVGGETQELRVGVQPAVDLGPYLCADLHQHASPSPDSGVALPDRVASNLGEGLNVIVPTDHNALADWAPAVAALRLTHPPLIILGDEATLDFVGHWNAYPLVYHAGQPRGGALDVRGMTAQQIVAGLRDTDGRSDKVVQVNHPRAGVIGYFNTIHFDRSKPPPANFERDIDAIEVFGGKDNDHVDGPLADWLALLDRGLVYTAVGGSDSHVVVGQEVGYPRTCVAAATAAELVDGIKRRRDVFVTNGPKILTRADGKPMGSLVAANGRAKIRVEIEVDAAPWVDVRRVELYTRAGKLPTIALAAGATHWRGNVEVALRGSDEYLVALVRGDRSLEPVVSRRPGRAATTPLAIANPIFFDGDGDGRYSASRQAETPPAKPPTH